MSINLQDLEEVLHEIDLDESNWEDFEKPWISNWKPLIENIDFHYRLLTYLYDKDRCDELPSRELMIGVHAPLSISLDISLPWQQSSTPNKEELDLEVERNSRLLNSDDDFTPKHDFVIDDLQTLFHYLCHIFNIRRLETSVPSKESETDGAEQSSESSPDMNQFLFHCADFPFLYEQIGDNINPDKNSFLYNLLYDSHILIDYLPELLLMSEKSHFKLIELQRKPLFERLLNELFSDDKKYVATTYNSKLRTQTSERHCATFTKIKYSFGLINHRRKYLQLKKMYHFHHEKLLELNPPPKILPAALRSMRLPPHFSYRSVLRDNIECFTTANLRRILRQGGILYEEDSIYDEMRSSIKHCIQTLMIPIFSVVKCRQLNIVKVISCDDVLTALTLLKSKQQPFRTNCMNVPSTVYGYGVDGGFRHVFTQSIIRIARQVHSDIAINALAMSVLNDIATTICLDVLHVAHQLKQRDASMIGPEDKKFTEYYDDSDLQVNYDESHDERERREFAEYHVGQYDGIMYGEGKRYIAETNHLDGSPIMIKFYFDLDDVPDTDIDRDYYVTEDEQRQIITTETLSESYHVLFATEIFKHARSESVKAVRRFDENGTFDWSSDVGNGDERETADMCGLQIIPEHILLLSKMSITAPKFLTLDSAIYLAAGIEYILGEILELAGNEVNLAAANGLKENHLEITSRSILLGIEKDEELKHTIPGIIRGGGVTPYIPTNSMPNLDEYPLEYIPDSEALLNEFAEDVKQNGPRVHPLTGEYVVFHINDDDIADSQCSPNDYNHRAKLLPPCLRSLRSCSLLNALSIAPIDERQALALLNCEQSDQETWQSMMIDPRMSWLCRLYEVIQAQEDTLSVFKIETVWLYMNEILQDYVVDMDFTFEAALLCQSMLEYFLVSIARKTAKMVDHRDDGRIIIKASDWKLASNDI